MPYATLLCALTIPIITLPPLLILFPKHPAHAPSPQSKSTSKEASGTLHDSPDFSKLLLNVL